MQNKKFRALAAILLSVIMLSTSLTAAFAAGTEPSDSTDATKTTTSWHRFPVQKRWAYDTSYTYAIQTVLKYCSNGRYSSLLGDIDGKFGPGTQKAVKSFQLDHNLEDDGQVGPATWDQLYRQLRFITNKTDPATSLSYAFYSVNGYEMDVPIGSEHFLFRNRLVNNWEVHVPITAGTFTSWTSLSA